MAGERTRTESTGGQAPGPTSSVRIHSPMEEATALASCAHEVQNVLTSVYGWVQLARASNDAALHARAFSVIERGIARASALVGGMADPSERWRVRMTPFQPAAVMSEVYELLHPRCSARAVGLTLTIEPGCEGVVALGDATRVGQVLTNFVLNALDATLAARTPGEAMQPIALELKATEAEVAMVVRDHGTGMDDATRTHLFEPFFTTHAKAEGERAAGTGLGMSITMEFVRAMGARLDVNSALGQGTAMGLWLARERPSDPPPAVPELPNGTRVVVVDDDATIRELLEVALTLRGLKVRVLSTIDEARAELRRGGVDVLLVDDSLGGVAAGAAFLEETRATAPGVGRVLMTGAPEAEAAALSCDHLVRKPFLLDEVVQALWRAINARPKP